MTPALVLTALRRIGLPAIQARTQPEDKTLVNFDTIFYAEPQTFTRTITLLGQSVDVEAQPTRYVWHHGDGTSAATSTPGAPYPSKQVTHAYTDAHRTVLASVDVVYSARFRVGNGAWQDIAETVTIAGPSTPLRISEATPVLSGDLRVGRVSPTRTDISRNCRCPLMEWSHHIDESREPPMSNRPRPQVGPPPRHDDLRALPDRELLDVAVQCQVRKNRDTAREIETYAEMRRRCEADYEVRRSRGSEHFVLTPLDETAIELAGALQVDEHKVKLDLHLRDKLVAWFPALWDRCLDGRLDLGRARIFVDNAEQLADPDDIPELAQMVEDYLQRHDDPTAPLVSLTYRQLSNATRYRRLKFEQKSAGQGFAEAFQKRTAWLRIDENGIGTLGASGAAHDLTACDYRLTLIAKKRCQDPDDDRTLEQMRADTLRDLILGRLTVTALDADLEADRTAEGADPGTTFTEHEVGSFARPVVHVTVPLSTLMGTSDEPGFLTGDNPDPCGPAPADRERPQLDVVPPAHRRGRHLP